MKVVTGRSGDASVSDVGKLSGEKFVGNMALDTKLQVEGVRISSAVFLPGSRTWWHTHSVGQIFLIEHGRGAVGTREETRILQAGDVVYTPAGEEHWHGAAPDSMFSYTVISLGDTEFIDEEVCDSHYLEAWKND